MTFSDGQVKRYDMASYFEEYPSYKALKDRNIFTSGKLIGRSVIIWNDVIDIHLEEIYEEGKTVRKVKALPNVEIGEVVSCTRYDSEVTQKQLSELTGIDQSDISKIERGAANPSVGTLKKIAKALGKELRISFVDASEEE